MLRVLLHFPDSVFRTSLRPVPIASLGKQRFIDWHELLRHGLLYGAVYDGGDAKLRTPPSGFGISTRRTGFGVYFPRLILSTSSLLWLSAFK